MTTRGYDVRSIIEILEPGKDCVVKSLPEDFNVGPGRDIDIFTLNPDRLIKKLISYIPETLNLDVQVLEITKSQWHLDIYDDEFMYRLDLYSSFPSYTQFLVREELFREIVESSVWVCAFDEPRTPEPKTMYSALIRYFEFVNSFWVGTEKTHHLEWILSELKPEEIERLYVMAHWSTLPRTDKESSRQQRADLLGKMTVIASGAVRKSPLVHRAARSLLSRFPRIERYLIAKLSQR